MRRVPIRMKLALALAVPLLALTTVTVIEVFKASGQAEAVETQTSLAQITVGPTGLITALQDERTWAVLELIGGEEDVAVPIAGYAETRRNTDAALGRFRDELGAVPATAEEAYRQAIAGLGALEQIRADIDASASARDIGNLSVADEVFTRYSDVILPFLDANTEVALAINDPEMRLGVEMIDTTTRQIEALADLARSTLVTAVSTDGIDTAEEITRLAMLQASVDRGGDALRTAGGRYRAIVDEHFPTELSRNVGAMVDDAIETGTTDIEAFIQTVNVPVDQGFGGLRQHVARALETRAAELDAAAGARNRWFIFMATATLAVALMLTWLVSRSITRPLRSLTKQAKEMAQRRLPDAVLEILETPLGEDVQVPKTVPVTVQTRDEVADVADALNTVQETALDLAAEQAVLRRNIADSFVNLGRRNQNLLGRQLDFITELESHETDPDTLASLFRLDHLATRMRRNAESLLVLAGIDPPRKWAAPVRLSDVIRAALGEVEDYQRVTVRDVEPATILGSAAADLAHLVAEFIENALTFSPPDRHVEVRGQIRPIGTGYTLAVVDSGFGMSPDDVEAANRRLGGTESFTIAPSKYLGHYVAGHLAARHGIRLQLAPTPGGGVTATIHVPPALLTSDEPTSDPITDPHGRRAVTPASNGGAAAVLGVPATSAAVNGTARAADPVPWAPLDAGRARPAEAAAPARPGETPAPPSSPAPERVADSGPQPRPTPADAPLRTPSGLVKRTRQTPASPAAAAPPPDDVLAELARRRPPRRDAVPAPPAEVAQRRRRPLRGRRNAEGSLRGRRSAGGRTAPTGAAGQPSAPADPGPGPASAASAGTPAPAAEPPPAPAGTPSAASAGAAPGAPEDDGPTGGRSWGAATVGGLVRRVRGANLPSRDPVAVRRRDRPAGGEPPTSRTPDDVYGFLSSFTSGVQRGLDEGRPPMGG